jgi:hypothetical protein
MLPHGYPLAAAGNIGAVESLLTQATRAPARTVDGRAADRVAGRITAAANGA